jgi:cytochrome c peroxidase
MGRISALLMLVVSAGFAVLAVACQPAGDSDSKDGNDSGGPGGGGPGGPLVVETTSLPSLLAGINFNFQLKVRGGTGNYTWTMTQGAISNGLTISSTGLISGQARVTGSWKFVLLLDDGVTQIIAPYTLEVFSALGDPLLEIQLQTLLSTINTGPLRPQDIPTLNSAQVELGKLLFFDKELSGTRDVACATCHHPSNTSGDKLNLSIGVGGTGGVGPGRDHPAKIFIPRNSAPLFNLHLVHELFWDARVNSLPPTTPGGPYPTNTPEGPIDLPAVEALTLFPIVDFREMRGTGHSLDGLSNEEYRDALIVRLSQIPDYVQRFDAAFGAGGLTVENMARALGAWLRSQMFIESAWDRYLRGDSNALTEQQKRGAFLFFGRAGCPACHVGQMLSNFTLHNIGVPQFGPGQGNGPTGTEDYGAENVVGNPIDRYAFRVPVLRNVAFTGPYMHNGAFETLEEVMLHYRNKAVSTINYTGLNMKQAADLAPTLLPSNLVLSNVSVVLLSVPNDLNIGEITDIRHFMEAMTDPAAINRTQDIPDTVPSGLPVDR